jgi:hypothetical protein
MSWDRFINGPANPEDASAFIAHGDELVKVLAHLKRQADGKPGEQAQPLSSIHAQDLVSFLERVEVALRAFGNMMDMTDSEGVRMTATKPQEEIEANEQ